MSWLRSRRSAITFDLGAAGIRAFQFCQAGRVPRLCDALVLERPAPTPNGEAATPAAPPVDPAQMDRLIGQGRFSGSDVTLILSQPEVQFFPIRLPEQVLRQPADRIEQALKWEVSQESRRSADSFEVRHWPLPRGRGQQANVMAVALPASFAQEWCDLFQRHRLNLHRMDVSPCALVRLARQIWTPADSDLWGVLDLGLRHSTLTLVVGTVPAYIRSVAVSAHEWTRRIAEAFEVSYPVAEQLKREHGIQPTDRGHRAGPLARHPLQDGGDLTDAISSVLREPLRLLAQEVGRCFSYIMQAFPECAARQLLLAGGGAALRGLPELLEAHLGIAVKPLGVGCEGALAWERPLPDVQVEPRAAAALGGAILDLEAA